MSLNIKLPENLTSVTQDGETFSMGYVVEDGVVTYVNPMPYEELEILHQQMLEEIERGKIEIEED